MPDLTNRKLIIAKGVLFLVMLVIASAALFAESPRWRTGLLLAVVIWSAARLYYFLFYVLHQYVDPRLRYAGVGALLRQIIAARRGDRS